MFFSIFELKNQKKIPVIYVVSSLSKEVKWQRCKKKLWPNYRWRKESLNYQVLWLWFWFCQQGVWRWLEYLKSAVRMMGVTQRAPGFNGPILSPLYGWNLSFFFGGEISFKRFGIPFITGSSQLVMSDPLHPSKSWVFDPSKNGSDQFETHLSKRGGNFWHLFFWGKFATHRIDS